MANSFYSLGINLFLNGGIDATSNTIKASLLSTTYTPNLATDQYYGISVAGGAIIAAGVALASKTTAAGTLSAANTLWTSVSGSAASYICIYKDTGVANTSPLICLIDTATGLPVTPNGGDITAAWAGGAVFTLMQGVKESDRKLVERMADWFRGVLGIPAERDASGLWIPSPNVQLA